MIGAGKPESLRQPMKNMYRRFVRTCVYNHVRGGKIVIFCESEFHAHRCLVLSPSPGSFTYPKIASAFYLTKGIQYTSQAELSPPGKTARAFITFLMNLIFAMKDRSAHYCLHMSFQQSVRVAVLRQTPEAIVLLTTKLEENSTVHFSSKWLICWLNSARISNFLPWNERTQITGTNMQSEGFLQIYTISSADDHFCVCGTRTMNRHQGLSPFCYLNGISYCESCGSLPCSESLCCLNN